MLSSRHTAVVALSLAGLLCLGLAGCPVFQSQDTPHQEVKCLTPAGDEYFLYVPSSYDPKKPCPLVITLHGTRGYDNDHDQINEWKALAEEQGFIVAAPELASTQGILPISHASRMEQLAQDEQRILNIYADLKLSHKIDSRHVMLTGFSGGGFPMYYVGMRNPDLFPVLVARSCNFDQAQVQDIPITDRFRSNHLLIFHDKSGLDPIYSGNDVLTKQSLAAYKYYREAHCYNTVLAVKEGGHLRRPEAAWEFLDKYINGKLKDETQPAKKAASRPTSRPAKP
jgi:dienelactone hydrolase